MADSTKQPVPPSRGRWLRRALRWLVVLGVLIAVPLSFELTRWSPLPDDPLPVSKSGPAVGTATGVAASAAVLDWLGTRPVTGLTACVGAGGEVLWCSAAGYADVPRRRPLQPTTSMRIGSVSKTVSSILLARLDERGLVDLDRPLGALPDLGLPAHLSSVTLRQLASHTAGIGHYEWRFRWPPHETWSRRRYDSVRESLETFVSDELLFEPGTSFRYSTHGYVLLGAVVGQATGRSFGELLQQELVDPLGLSSTGLEDGKAGDQGRALPYEMIGRRYRNAMRVDNSRAWPGGGIRSSAHDLARLASGLPRSEGVRADTLERYLAPQKLSDGTDNPQRYALGWRIAHTSKFLGGRESYRVAHHGGVSSGGSAFLLLFPEHSVAAAVITNTRTGSGALVDLAFDVVEPFMAEEVGAAGTNEGEVEVRRPESAEPVAAPGQ